MTSALFQPGARWRFVHALAWIATRDERVVSACHCEIAWGELPKRSDAPLRVRKAVDKRMAGARKEARQKSISAVFELVSKGRLGEACDELCDALSSGRISATIYPSGSAFPPTQVAAIRLDIPDSRIKFPDGTDDISFTRSSIMGLWPSQIAFAGLTTRPTGHEICDEILTIWNDGISDGKNAYAKFRKKFDRQKVKKERFDKLWRFMTGGRGKGVKVVPADAPVSKGRIPDQIPE